MSGQHHCSDTSVGKEAQYAILMAFATCPSVGINCNPCARNGPHQNGVPKGIRTPVAAVKGQCPRPLDDGDAGLKTGRPGGARRDRTADLLHAMQALSQLSYSPNGAAHCTDVNGTCQLFSALILMSSMAPSKRLITRSFPISHTVSSIGGDTEPPVTATRIG